jgi:alkanesulfonate monooxygenase SsuD/methylene tetrahydromethanopterin reductase-like flavin-dependent oxidoreductase (luciferase family)
VRFSIWPNLQQPWADVLEVAQHAEATGWDGIYVADHFMGDGVSFGDGDTPTLEATASVAALAAATTRLRLGTLVLGMTYRHPAVLAKWAATVDHASGGRLLLGIGTGWQENEHDQYGIRLGPPGERLSRFDEGCQIILGLLRAPRTSIMGGKGDRMLGLVARYADEWNMWGLAETIAERGAVLDTRCERIGRDPATIARSAQALVRLTDDADAAQRFLARTGGRAAVAGPVEAVVDAAAALRDVGVGELIVPDFALGRGAARLERMDELIAALAPALGSA